VLYAQHCCTAVRRAANPATNAANGRSCCPYRFSTKNKIESCPQAGDLPAGPGSGAGRAQASRLRPKKLHHTRESPVRGSRRKVGGTSRLTGSMARPVFTRSSSAFMRRTSFTTRWMIAPAASAPRARTMMGGGIETRVGYSSYLGSGRRLFPLLVILTFSVFATEGVPSSITGKRTNEEMDPLRACWCGA
jgi:hypothetical protein